MADQVGPFTLTIVGKRTILVNGKPYVGPGTMGSFHIQQITPDLYALVTAGVITSVPAIPSDAETLAIINSNIQNDPLVPTLGQGGPVFDSDINPTSQVDYVHGLGSLYVGLVGSVQKLGTSDVVVEEIVIPSNSSPGTINMQYIVKDANTITFKNLAAFKTHVKAKAIRF
jgi:hypothetical protein